MATKFQERIYSQGLCDERRVAFCVNATNLPNGEYGFVLLCVYGNNLNIYDINLKNEVGDRLYSVPLSKISGLKAITKGIRIYFSGRQLSFKYEGNEYAFKNFGKPNIEIDVIMEEASKKD